MAHHTLLRRGIGRRDLLKSGLAAGGAFGASLIGAPAILRAQGARPVITHGLQAGDVSADGAMIWARADRPARPLIEVATTDSFRDPTRLVGPDALEASDFTVKMPLHDLPAGQNIFYRVRFQDLADLGALSEPEVGHFRTAPAAKRDIALVWSGDTAGQGWGINLDWGGMKIYETMRGDQPDLFIHCGDMIYADGPIKPEVTLTDGSIWKNVTLEEKAKVAETLAEFRACYKYNLMDENVRRFNSQVPILGQWDDHETVNNWYPSEILDRDDYKVKSVALLAARGRRAMMEYVPIRPDAWDAQRVYRTIRYGPSLDIFFLDMRSYRGPNTANRQAARSTDTEFLGAVQMRWLKQQLLASNATWKIISSDMPVGLVVADGDNAFENLANGDGPALGRELEMAELLSFIKRNDIRNVVWLTADVHYTAAHHYDPNQAQFTDFAPFWEFVAGPLNAGTFGPNKLDNTFGPKVVYALAPQAGQANLPPSAGMQFYGQVHIDGQTDAMHVALKDLGGKAVFEVDLDPATI